MKFLNLALRFMFGFILIPFSIGEAQTNSGGAKRNSCSYINLTEKGGPFHSIPTFDQGGGQICYAFAAAQIIEGERVSQGHTYSKEKAVSPISIAIAHALSRGQQDIQQGGITCDAVEAVRRLSVCPIGKTFANAEQVEELIAEFRRCRNSRNEFACARPRERLSKNPLLSSAQIAKLLSQNNPLIYIRAIEEAICPARDRIQMKMPVCEKANDEIYSSNFFRQKVDSVFNSVLPRAVQIGFSHHIFGYGKIESKAHVIPRQESDDLEFSMKYKPHASILLGRRTKDGRCQYLLRNSQGPSFCPSGIVATQKWECDQKSEGIWINAQELFDATFEISHFKD